MLTKKNQFNTTDDNNIEYLFYSFTLVWKIKR